MNIAIIGGGRFGSLLEKHLQTNNSVSIFDKGDDLTDVSQAELIILAVPNTVVNKAAKQVQPFVGSDAIVMDVGSVKVQPCSVLQELFEQNILGTHPLFGPDSAGDSWDGHKMVFCRLSIDDRMYTEVQELFTSRGVQVIEATPEEHDRMMARTQALVHFIGRALEGAEPQEIFTPDYANLLHMMDKVTNDTWELFFDMQTLNPYAEEERKKFIDQLQKLEATIHDHNS